MKMKDLGKMRVLWDKDVGYLGSFVEVSFNEFLKFDLKDFILWGLRVNFK